MCLVCWGGGRGGCVAVEVGQQWRVSELKCSAVGIRGHHHIPDDTTKSRREDSSCDKNEPCLIIMQLRFVPNVVGGAKDNASHVPV